jgi:hypothetical protein
MPDDRDFDDERPTKPDLQLLPCPDCRDDEGHPTGEVLRKLVETSHGHRSVRGRCPTCFGELKVDRATYARAMTARRDP